MTTTTPPRTRTISVDTLARVEGEGGMYLRIRDDRVRDLRLRIYEPPRFFEGFLEGRSLMEAPDITARICGICPVAYQMSSSQAMEDALGIDVSREVRALRRLLYCGEWIESHALHMFLLHAPDFLHYEDAIQMARDHADLVRRALMVKKLGNDLVSAIGGREVHPVNVRVGGFHRAIRREELIPFRERLLVARDEAVEFARWTANLPIPSFELDYEFVALRHRDEYAINQGRVVSTGGIDIDVDDFDQTFSEEHVPHSNALHSRIRGRGAYMVGPLARFNLNFDTLPPMARDVAAGIGLIPNVRNPFLSICVRAIELLFACDEALRIIESYEPPDPPFIEAEPRDAIGTACTEAPRGTLYHRYEIDSDGIIEKVRIIPPTSQNLKRIEEDLLSYVEHHVTLPRDEMTWRCEQVIRNYDPCISCATHFLKMEMDRE